ncbi:hypothetical protein [Ramlibacter sp.]|uniref:hypothetical protein n=1 Tax=Ramlibacter sp. TaxID=1917967 RepID=UPI003D14D956
MAESADASQPLRHAALALHALQPVDREWLLGQLPPGRRAELAPLLDELRALGIPADRTLLDSVVHGGPLASRAATGGVSDARASLRAADPELIVALLQREPAMLIARLLQLERWPWHSQLLALLEAPRRRTVEQILLGLDATRQPVALQRLLIAELNERVAKTVRIEPREAPRHGRVARACARWMQTLVQRWRAPRGFVR